MKSLEERQKDMYEGLWFGTVVLAILLIYFWFFSDFDLEKKIKYTVYISVALSLAWIFFYRQKKKDQNRIKENLGDKVIKAHNVVHGISLKFYSIKYIILSILFLIGGIIIILNPNGYLWIGIVLIILAVLIPIVIKTFWKVGGQKLKGRHY